jgi:N-acetylglucosamine-6-phosphate deacetylase
MSYFDIQVNGYGGIDFNQDDLSAEGLHSACQSLRNDEVDCILATIITETPDKMVRRLKRLVQLRHEDSLAKEMIAGFHIEGPFLSPVDGYRGAHPLDAICLANEDLAMLLVEAGAGLVRLFTLAPEQDNKFRVTQMLAEQDIMVSAGHTNASVDQLKAAIDAGLSMFTHLGNGCPMNMPRHDNIIQRALSLRKDLWLCFIADGVHIPFHALRNYLDLALETGRCIVTTDAMAAAGLGPGEHRISRWKVTVGEDLAAWADDGSHLLGSAMSMNLVARNLIQSLGFDAKAVGYLTNESPRVAFDFAGKGFLRV